MIHIQMSWSVILIQEGALFMQEMIELSKMEQSEVANKPVHVQLISHPFLGSLAFRGGPAQFGPRLENIEGVRVFNAGYVVLCFFIV